MFDLDADTLVISDHLGKDKYLANIISRYPGLRLPGCWDGFEMTVK
jgi:AraC family transcriptional regulator of adaptative response / DNA-3-methyladenine glycosylase II